MAKSWINTVQNNYTSQEDLGYYDELYNVCFRAGYTGENRVKQMWDDNKIIGGSIYPADFGLATAEEIANLLVSEYQAAIEFTEHEIIENDNLYADVTLEKIKDDLTKFIESIGMDQLQKIVNLAGGKIFKEVFPHDRILGGFSDSTN